MPGALIVDPAGVGAGNREEVRRGASYRAIWSTPRVVVGRGGTSVGSGRPELPAQAPTEVRAGSFRWPVHPPAAVLLWVAAGLAIVAGQPPLAIAIVVVIVLNAIFAFAQEYRADRSAERLTDLLPRNSRVRRDGRAQTIDASLLVVGDVVLLASRFGGCCGTKVPPSGDIQP